MADCRFWDPSVACRGVALTRFALRSTMVVVAIVLMAIDVIALSIFATRNLTLSAIGAAIVQLLRTLQRRSSDAL